jgi:flagellar biosynthesis chaperone FliJ
MNDVKTMKQYETVIQALNQQKKVEQDAIARISAYINKKKNFILKITAYRKDYDSVNGLRLSHQIPALNINLNHFLVKMQNSIHTEEKAIAQAEMDKASVAKRLAKVEQKIKAMEVLLKKKKHHQARLSENREADALDELASTYR